MNSLLKGHSDKLYYFYQIALCGSLHKAARQLAVSPPTLSYSIKALEEALKKPLLIRSKTGVGLTPAGEILLQFCHRHFAELQRLEADIQQADGEKRQQIRAGTFPSIAIYFWPHLLKAMETHHNIQLSLMTNRSYSVLETLLQRQIDVALTVEAPKHLDLIRHELYEDSYSFYCSADQKIGKDLYQLPLLYMPEAIDHEAVPLKQHIMNMSLPFEKVFEVDSLEVIAQFVTHNYGVGVLPTQVGRTYKKQLKKLNLKSKKLPQSFGMHRFYMCYRKDLDLSQKLISAFLKAAQQSVTELNKAD